MANHKLTATHFVNMSGSNVVLKTKEEILQKQKLWNERDGLAFFEREIDDEISIYVLTENDYNECMKTFYRVVSINDGIPPAEDIYDIIEIFMKYKTEPLTEEIIGQFVDEYLI
jgi:hypothetical protein